MSTIAMSLLEKKKEYEEQIRHLSEKEERYDELINDYYCVRKRDFEDQAIVTIDDRENGILATFVNYRKLGEENNRDT